MQQCTAENPPGTPSLHLMLTYPLKRLSIYRDLVNAICQATQTTHPDHANLMRAMDMINLVAGELKNERLMAQDQLALWDIQSSMVGLPEPIMIPSRRLLLRADMHKCDSALALEPRTYYLMNDVLLYSRFDPKKNIHTFKVCIEILLWQCDFFCCSYPFVHRSLTYTPVPIIYRECLIWQGHRLITPRTMSLCPSCLTASRSPILDAHR